jgi:DNA-binding MarR family transcriptional regulator
MSVRNPRSAASAPSVAAPSADAGDSAVRVLRRFRVVFNAVKSHFQQVERKSGVGGAQLWALSVIQAHPDIGVSDLARAMDVHQSTASNLVKALVAMEMVTAVKQGRDRRSVQLRLLPGASRVLSRAPGPFAGVLPQALSRLEAGALDRLDHDLGLLIAELQADEKAGGIPLAQM